MRRTFIIITLALIWGCSKTSSENKSEETNHNSSHQLKTLESPAGPGTHLPYLIAEPDDKLYLSWEESKSDTAVLKYATLDNHGWSVTEEISKGTNWFVNRADYPMVSVNENGSMIAHFLAESSTKDFSYNVNIVRKPISQNWSRPLVPHQDGTPTEHGFVTMLPQSDNSFQLAWLDGRNTFSEGQEHSGAMTLRSAILDVNGALSEELELDDRVCDCCQTGGAITDNGPILVYRDRSESEERDIAIVRLVNGSWTAPKTIYEDHWKIAGCPVNGPRAYAIGNNLAVAWFSAAGNNPQVKIIFSKDGGEHFSEALTIDDQYPLGRVDVVLLDKDRAMVSWLGKEGTQSLIKARVAHRSGLLESPIVIAESDEARGSGFPQMAIYHEQVYFAWSQLLENGRSQINIGVLEEL